MQHDSEEHGNGPERIEVVSPVVTCHGSLKTFR